MKKGQLTIDWSKINELSDSQTTYYLYLEGKSVEVISKIRNLDNSLIQKHIMEEKMKHRYMVNIRCSEDIFRIFESASKEDKLAVLSKINSKTKEELIKYIKENYIDMRISDKSTAAWIIGELKSEECINILLKASVHKAVTVRRMAISAMGKMENKSCEDAIIRALKDDNQQVVFYAINALKKIKSEKAKEKVQDLRKCNKEYIIRAIDDYLKSI